MFRREPGPLVGVGVRDPVRAEVLPPVDRAAEPLLQLGPHRRLDAFAVDRTEHLGHHQRATRRRVRGGDVAHHRDGAGRAGTVGVEHHQLVGHRWRVGAEVHRGDRARRDLGESEQRDRGRPFRRDHQRPRLDAGAVGQHRCRAVDRRHRRLQPHHAVGQVGRELVGDRLHARGGHRGVALGEHAQDHRGAPERHLEQRVELDATEQRHEELVDHAVGEPPRDEGFERGRVVDARSRSPQQVGGRAAPHVGDELEQPHLVGH